ncbi:hypothetical protein F5878DRAFT_647799 [Lentinula raphanica]|uniref:Uncharacterized protein n=1 Tax=Lentinula raphanica TaxID=153919 RepID=A0AA38U9H4_9AGAR|nr:hypothetical protein F5878DRAFT_647799 [Lentinula raphanica]
MPCSDCSSEGFDCYDFMPLAGIADECICGHQASVHHRNAVPQLPPRGGYGRTGCVKFMPPPLRTKLPHLVLKPYVFSILEVANVKPHIKLIRCCHRSELPPPSLVSSQRATPWINPLRTAQNLTVNDRRLQAAQKNLHMYGGATNNPLYTKGAAANRTPRHTFPGSQILKAPASIMTGSSLKGKGMAQIAVFKGHVFYFPEMAPLDIDAYEPPTHSEYRPPANMVFHDVRMANTLRLLDEHNLGADFSIPLDASSSETRPQSVILGPVTFDEKSIEERLEEPTGIT